MHLATLIAITLTFIVSIAAQSLYDIAANIPACALPALINATTAVDCDVADYSCHCVGETQRKIAVYSSAHVVEACGADASEVMRVINLLCEAVKASSSASASPTLRETHHSATSTIATSVNEHTHDSNLSTTAKVGIGAGIGGAALILSAIALLVCRRHRRKDGHLKECDLAREEEPEKAELAVTPPRFELAADGAYFGGGH